MDVKTLFSRLERTPAYLNPEARALIDASRKRMLGLEIEGKNAELSEAKRVLSSSLRGVAERLGIAVSAPRPAIGPESAERLDLETQYAARLGTLARFGFIESPEDPAIEGIDGKTYPAPTLGQIMAKITPEKAKLIETHIKSPMLLLVPFAMPLKAIAGKAGRKKDGMLGQEPVYTEAYDIDSDLPERGKGKEQLVYFPRKYDPTSSGGFTKSELLRTEGGPNAFPGWQVLVVDGTETTPEDTRGKSAIALKTEFDALGLSGLTPEEWLLLHAEGTLAGIPFDDYQKNSADWNLASYLKKSGDVPRSDWDPGNSQAFLFRSKPVGSGERLGSRRAVRIY